MSFTDEDLKRLKEANNSNSASQTEFFDLADKDFINALVARLEAAEYARTQFAACEIANGQQLDKALEADNAWRKACGG